MRYLEKVKEILEKEKDTILMVANLPGIYKDFSGDVYTKDGIKHVKDKTFKLNHKKEMVGLNEATQLTPCWFDEKGKQLNLDNKKFRTHRDLAAHLLDADSPSPMQAMIKPFKVAYGKGWIRFSAPTAGMYGISFANKMSLKAWTSLKKYIESQTFSSFSVDVVDSSGVDVIDSVGSIKGPYATIDWIQERIERGKIDFK